MKHPTTTPQGPSKPLRAVLLALALLTLPSAAPGQEASSAGRAAAIEAAYLRYVAEFTTWPEGSFTGPEAPVVLGVIGDDASGVAEVIRRAIEEKGLSAQSRPLVLRKLGRPPGADAVNPAAGQVYEALLDECHLLFLSRSERADWPALRPLLASRPIVTVSEIEGFSRAQGMIEFVTDLESGRVSMHIDLYAVKRARLALSSRLLGLKQGVTIVKPAGDTGACLGPRCEESGVEPLAARLAGSAP